MIYKSTFATYFFLALSTLILSMPLLAAKEMGPNLVKNPGFEDGVKDWTIRIARAVSDEVQQGEKSLRYENTNPASYRLQTQLVDVLPGQKIHFSAWVKGQDIVQRDSRFTASVFMQSYDNQGNYLGGSFPVGPTGANFNWAEVKGFYTVPAQATKTMIGVYLGKTVTGIAWFDNVSAQIEEQPQFVALLKYPNYRGITSPDIEHAWKVVLQDNSSDDVKAVQVKSTLQSPSGAILSNETRKLTSDKTSQGFSWQPQPQLAIGKYKWHFEVTADTGKVIEEQTLTVTVRASMPRVYIDSKGFTVVDGKRFFPLGVFTGGSRDGKESYTTSFDLDLVTQAGFNTVLAYTYGDREGVDEFLNEVESKGLHVIYSLKDMYGDNSNAKADSYINKIKNHPSLLAWFTNDEFGPDRIPELEERYQRILQTDDTDHPTYQALYQVNQLDGYLDSLDIIGSDPYPINDKPIKEVSEWTTQTVSAANSKTIKGVWQVLQLHDKTFRNPKNPMRAPTLEEMRNMSYQAMIEGTKGLIYFDYTWLWANEPYRYRNEAAFKKRWPDVQKVIHEVEPLTKVLLIDDKVNLKALTPSTAQYQAWQYEGKLYIMVVNATEDKEESLQLQIPSGWQLRENNISGLEVRLNNNVLNIRFAPLASGTIILARQ